jgi:hypothetical protein
MKARQAAERAAMSRHVSLNSRPRLPVEVGFGAAIRPMSPNPASKIRRAPVLPRVSRLQTSIPCRGGLWHRHASYCRLRALPPCKGGLWHHNVSGGSLRAVWHKNKERHTRVFSRHACVVPMHAHVFPRHAR